MRRSLLVLIDLGWPSCRGNVVLTLGVDVDVL